MTTKFTPGPWSIERGETSKRIVGADGYAVAACRAKHYRVNEHQQIRDANAHLIAAAPDGYKCAELLESLCAWLLNRFGPDSPEGKEATFRHREAIAMLSKARGET